MRNMAFSLTTEQVRARTKTVTRRLSCGLKQGEHFMAIEKGQGIKKGAHVVRICELVCVSNRREELRAIRDEADGTAREGFPLITPEEFILFFCAAHKGKKVGPETEINRVEFKYA